MPRQSVVSEQELIDRIIAAETAVTRAAINAIFAARSSLGSLNNIATLIQQGRIEDLVQLAAQAGALEVSRAYAAVYNATGTAAANNLGNVLDASVNFDQYSERAVQRVREHRLRLVREWTDTQRAAGTAAVQRGIERGANPRDQAREFRATTGLTARQEQAVANYRTSLERAHRGSSDALSRELRDHRFDRTVIRAANTGEPLTAAQIDRMVARYRERYVKYRAEVIARTEALRAVNSGLTDSFRQFTADGVIPEGEVEREWMATFDGRTRPTHQAAHGQTTGLNTPFIVGGYALMFPGDPDGPPQETIQCRCTTAINILTP